MFECLCVLLGFSFVVVFICVQSVLDGEGRVTECGYTGKLCHCGKCHSGNCHSGERWMSRPFVHSGNLNFKHTLTNDLVFHNA